MSYKGIVKKNMVVLIDNVKLSDGTQVIVIPEKEIKEEPMFDKDPFLNVDDWAPIPPEDIPDDLAHRHDYYLYGKE